MGPSCGSAGARPASEVCEPGAIIHTDGKKEYVGIDKLGYEHIVTVMKNEDDPAHVEMPACHRVASLVKRWLLGTHHGGVARQHLDAYLDEVHVPLQPAWLTRPWAHLPPRRPPVPLDTTGRLRHDRALTPRHAPSRARAGAEAKGESCVNIQRAMPDLIRRSIRHPVWLVAASALAVAAFGGTAKATFTPAGMTFTHSSGRHAARSIWIAAADGSGARQVASDGANASLSADGRWLAFNNGKVVLVDLVTGRRRSLGRSPDSECEIFWYCTNNLVWAPNGPRLAVNLRNGFSLIDAPSGRVTRLLGNRVGSFDFTPDGKRIVFSHDGTNSLFSGRSDIFALTLSNGRVRRLTNDGHSRSPVASRAGIAFVRDVEKYGQSSPEVWWMNWDGSSRRLLARCCANPKHLAGGAIGYETVDISNDGRHLLICQSSEMSCAPVALDLATDHMHQLAGGSALDLAADGNSVLVSFHPWDDEPGPDLIDSIPFGGGKPRLLVRQAVLGHWRG